MSSIDLMELQDLEFSIDHSRKALVVIKNQLEGNNPAKVARANFLKTQEEFKILSVTQKEFDDTLSQLVDRISATEKSLYRGTSFSSKELSGLQKDLDSLNKRKSNLEEELILLMDKCDNSKVTCENAEQFLEREEKTWNEKAKILMKNGQNLYSQMRAVDLILKNTRGKLPKELLDLYDKLKISKGFAVAKLEKEICSGCGVALPVSEVQQVRNSKQIYHCRNCSRILVEN